MRCGMGMLYTLGLRFDAQQSTMSDKNRRCSMSEETAFQAAFS